ncbi:hypothetical protein AB0J82_38255 [Asanoa sp. NPDC049518]|uniref:hypothetical protein n=1 Tax=unclassified Asanoa TaxID=2685164 RepID=UPI003441E320
MQAEQQFLAQGFTVVESTRGPMASSRVVLTDGVIDVFLFDDRGDRGVAAGVRGGTAVVIEVWARALGLPLVEPTGMDEQVAWTLDHLAEIRAAAERDPELGEKLKDVNWEDVKQRLGLRPEASRHDPRTWQRPT